MSASWHMDAIRDNGPELPAGVVDATQFDPVGDPVFATADTDAGDSPLNGAGLHPYIYERLRQEVGGLTVTDVVASEHPEVTDRDSSAVVDAEPGTIVQLPDGSDHNMK
ncbi:hypothetical protein [Halovenus rubra]